MKIVICDSCGDNIENNNGRNTSVPIHILEGVRGHVNGYVDSTGNPISGRTVSFDLCNSCFNLAFNEAMTVVKSLQMKSGFEPSLENKLY